MNHGQWTSAKDNMFGVGVFKLASKSNKAMASISSRKRKGKKRKKKEKKRENGFFVSPPKWIIILSDFEVPRSNGSSTRKWL